ncbi:MAG: DNA-binding protein [Thermofilum sp.]|jgi:predicted nucleic acid-binding protein|nr:DNA-binding protein [Thermofilum sp.]
MSTAVADTCFLVHWLRFRERERIFEVFESIAVPVMVLDEMGARGRVMLAPWLASRRAFLIPRINDHEVEALRLVEFSRSQRLPTLDPPEAYCLAVAKRRGYAVLTDNKAPKYLAQILKDYSTVKVLDSLDILSLIYGDDLAEAVKAYKEDTGLVFSKTRLKTYGINS